MSQFQKKDKDGNIIFTSDGRSWWYKCYYKDFDGKLKPKVKGSWKTKKEAKMQENLFLTQRDNPLHKKLDIIAIDYFEYLHSTTKESTYISYLRDYNKHIKPYFSNTNVDDITSNSIKIWKEEIDKKSLKLSYKNKVYSVFKCILDYAMKNYDLKINAVAVQGPFKEKNEEVIKIETKIRYITYDEFKQFISCVDNELYFAFFNFMYYTGVRKGEAFALKWEDVDFELKQIRINKTLSDQNKLTSPKTGEIRTIDMNKLLYDILLKLKQTNQKYVDFSEDWFVFGNVKYMASTTADRYKDYYFKKSGVRRITLHEFRHSHVSLLANEYIKTSRKNNMKVDIKKFFLLMSKRMGHSLEVMIRTYLHMFPNYQEEIVDLLDNLI